MKKIFVTGCFDVLHSGHVAFFQQASQYGDLYVALGNDANIEFLKNRKPVNSESERKYMVESIRYVKECFVSPGMGKIDFLEILDSIKPDVFVVNEDGSSEEKEKICKEKGIEYIVLERMPFQNLPKRSTTDIRKDVNLNEMFCCME